MTVVREIITSVFGFRACADIYLDETSLKNHMLSNNQLRVAVKALSDFFYR